MKSSVVEETILITLEQGKEYQNTSPNYVELDYEILEDEIVVTVKVVS